MSLLRLAFRQCASSAAPSFTRSTTISLPVSRVPAPTRLFSTSLTALARKQPKARPQLSKKALAAKARKKAAKARKNIYENEKMPITEAISVLRAVEVSRPNASYELVIKTAMPKGTVIPKGRINMPRPAKPKAKETVLVFAEGRQADEARRAGADIVGGPELADGVISGRYQATVILSTSSLIRAITPKLGRVLGPRGMMPSERRGTVTDDIAGYLKRLQGTEEWKGDKAGTIRTPIGKIDWPVEDVVKNVNYFLQTVKRATGNTKDAAEEKSKSVKPTNAITRVVLSSSYGPGIQLVV